MPPNNPMTEGEALAVLRELRDTGDVSDWQAMESALTMAVNRLTAHTAASAGEAMPTGAAQQALTGKYGDVLRPFVVAMEAELHANAGKGDRPGWLAMSAQTALLEIYYHLAKLQKAVRNEGGPLIQEYAADVANMSMMLLDICGGLALIGDDPPAPPPAAAPADALERLVAKWRENESTCVLRAYTIRHECADELAALIPKGAE